MKKSTMQRIKAGTFIPLFHGVVIIAFFLISGNFSRPFVWIYFFIQVLNSAVLVVFMDADLLNERITRRDDVKRWDLFFNRAFLLLGVSIFVVAGLDLRFALSPPVGYGLKIAALSAALAGGAFADWAVFTNSFFSRYVRIQKDRGHRVIDTGPYRLLRHPAYAASVLGLGTLPLVLGSLVAYAPAALYLVLIVLRTRREDETLKGELPGYGDYAARVKYRLIPGLF